MPPPASERPVDETGDPVLEPAPIPHRKKRVASKDLPQIAIELLEQIDQQIDDARAASVAALAEISKSNRATVRELQGMRNDIKTQFRILAASAFGIVFALIVALLYVVSLLASGNGNDPRIAAEAIRTVAPALRPNPPAEPPPSPARGILDSEPTP